MNSIRIFLVVAILFFATLLVLQTQYKKTQVYHDKYECIYEDQLDLLEFNKSLINKIDSLQVTLDSLQNRYKIFDTEPARDFIDIMNAIMHVESSGNANMLHVDAGKDAVGIGCDPDTNVALDVEGAIGLDEISAPTNTANRGQLYTNADNELHMIDCAGTDVVFRKSGKHTIWVPASAMYPNTTNGCSALTQVELSNGPELKVLDFDDGSDEFAQFTVAFPKSWNEGTITFQPFWTISATGTNTVAWQLAAVGFGNSDDINTAFGTAVATSAKAHSGTSGDMMVSDESGAITISGASADSVTYFQINRDTSADNHASDARLVGVKVFYTINAGNDE